MAIGDKIKSLRNQLELTQSQLVGNEMTKSMLSQVENNNAMPSMKNLKYIANKLGKPVSYFLDEDTLNEDIPISKIKSKLKIADTYAKNHQSTKVVEILEDILRDYKINKKSKLYADILYKNGVWQFSLGEFNLGDKYIKEAVEIYKENNLYSNAAKAYIEFLSPFWKDQNYDKCLDILNEAYNLYINSTTEDITFNLEYLLNKSLILSSMGRTKESFESVDEAIELSKETNVYYNTGEIYRLKASFLNEMEDYDNVLYNLDKAKKFAQFTDDNHKLALIEFVYGTYYLNIKEPKKAIEYLKNSAKIIPTNNNHFKSLYHNTMAMCCYQLGEYEKALDEISKGQYVEGIYHKVDYIYMWLGKVYEGLIHFKLGNTDKSIDYILKGIDKMESRGNSKYLSFAYKELSNIYSDLGDYEKAFKSLRRSEEITKELNGNPF